MSTSTADDITFDLKITEHGRAIVVRVIGTLDLAGRDLLRGVLRHLSERPVDVVWVDVAGVTSADSGTLSVFIYGSRVLGHRGIDMYLVAPSADLLRAMRRSGLCWLLPTVLELPSSSSLAERVPADLDPVAAG